MFDKVSYYWFRKTQFVTSIGLFYKNRGRLWRVSDCEELVVVTHKGMMGMSWRVGLVFDEVLL